MSSKRDSSRDSSAESGASTAHGDGDLHAVRNVIIPIDKLVPHPRNYNRHSDEQITHLQASDTEFGQVRSVVVQAGANGVYMLVAGHGYAESRKLNGKTHIRADLVPSEWTAEQIERYLIADNELARLSQPDTVLLAQMLDEQRAAAADLASLGFTTESLDELLAALADGVLADGSSLGSGMLGGSLGAHGDDERGDDDTLDRGTSSDRMMPPGDAEREQISEQYGIVIECASETEQVALLERFAKEGITCRALVL